MKQIFLALTAILGFTGAAYAQSWLPADYTRLSKTYTRAGEPATLMLTVDFPDAGAPYATDIEGWLTRMADNAFIPGSRYSGNITDRTALGEFVAHKFFRFARTEIARDTVVPNPYRYNYSMLVQTVAPGFVTYAITSQLLFGDKQTMGGNQLVTYLYNGGDATNDLLFRKNKFKAVKEALLNAAFADSGFMQSRRVRNAGISKASQLRPLFSTVDDGWEGMMLPPAALMPQGVVFSYSSPVAGSGNAEWWQFTVPYQVLRNCFTPTAQQAISESYPMALAKSR